jgi:hypothetical protein
MITILETGVATAAPTDLADGTLGVAVPYRATAGLFVVRNTAGSGTISLSPVLWGWLEGSSTWIEIGALNNGDPIAETSASDKIRYAERIEGLGPFSRFWIETGTLNGTNPTIVVEADLEAA